MKNILVLLIVVVSFSCGQSMFKKVDDSTNSGVSEGSILSDDERPAGIIIKHVKDDVYFNKDGKVLDKDGKIKLIRLDVKFDFDKYDIKDEYKNEIKKVAKFLKKHKTLSVTIRGHADSVGTYEYNYILSELRAKKVAFVLSSQGINEKRIKTKGFSEAIPIANNNSKDGRALNRRVDISFNK